MKTQYIWADSKEDYTGNKANIDAYLMQGKIMMKPCIVVWTNTGAKLATYSMGEALEEMASYVKQIETLYDDSINDSTDYEVAISIRCYIDPDGLHHGFYGECFVSYSYFK